MNRLGGCQRCGAYGQTPHTPACTQGKRLYRKLRPIGEAARERRLINRATARA